jgi:hypothetical protein
VLIAIGVLHLYWASEGLLLGRDHASLLRIVRGIEGARGAFLPVLRR